MLKFIGSALYIHNKLMGNKPLINNSPYLGPSFTNNYILEKAIELKIEKRNDFEIKKNEYR